MKSMNYNWVKARQYGDHASYVKGLANQGIGYIVLEEGKDNKGTYVVVAFKRPDDGIFPQHLDYCESYEIDKFEKIANRRTNNNGRQSLAEAASMFPKKES